MVQFIIGLCFLRHAPAAQRMAHQPGEDAVQHRKQRHADDHADKPEQPAGQQNGEHHPKAGKAGGIAQNFWAQDIAVELLQRKDKKHEVKRLERVDEKDKQPAGNGTDKRPEKRDDVRYAHHHADEHRIRHAQRCHPDKTQDADDEGIQQLAVDEAAEYPVSKTCVIQHDIGAAGAQAAVQQFFGLCGKKLFAVEHINGDDDADEYILEKGQGAQQPAHQVRQLGQHVRFYPCGESCHGFGIYPLCGSFELRVVLKRVLDPARHVLDAVRQQIGFHQPDDAGDHLRQHHPQQRGYKQQRQQHRKRRGKKFCGAGSTAWIFYVFLQRGRKAGVQPVEHRSQQISHGQPVHKRH